MRRAFLVVVAAGLAGLAVHALVTSHGRAFTLGVTSAGPVAELQPGDGACQGVIDVPRNAEFDTVRLQLGTYRRPGPPVRVVVRSDGGRRLAAGAVPGGYADIADHGFHDVRMQTVGDEQRVLVCVENAGARRVAVYGNADVASRATTATAPDGTPLDVDLNLEFRRSGGGSIASQVPAMLERASLFRPPGVSPWLYAVWLVLLVAAAPWALARAIGRARDEDAGAGYAPEAGEDRA
jgi:hypothetical protein